MRKIGFVAVICFLFGLSQIPNIFAWFSSMDQEENIMTVGFNEVEIQEEFPDPQIQEGKKIKKEVTFKNTGTVPCYVRAVVYFNDDVWTNNTKIVFNETKWKKESDGYFYYTDEVPPGASTEELMWEVEILHVEEGAKEAQLYIYTETVEARDSLLPQEAFAYLMK